MRNAELTGYEVQSVFVVLLPAGMFYVLGAAGFPLALHVVHGGAS